jgi:hypothetical protein
MLFLFTVARDITALLYHVSRYLHISMCTGRSARNPLVSASEDVEMSNLVTSSNRSGSTLADAADVESGE